MFRLFPVCNSRHTIRRSSSATSDPDKNAAAALFSQPWPGHQLVRSHTDEPSLRRIRRDGNPT